jgi:hypothetical protein
MSDFLGRLVSRAQGSARVLQPRVATRYASPTQALPEAGLPAAEAPDEANAGPGSWPAEAPRSQARPAPPSPAATSRTGEPGGRRPEAAFESRPAPRELRPAQRDPGLPLSGDGPGRGAARLDDAESALGREGGGDGSGGPPMAAPPEVAASPIAASAARGRAQQILSDVIAPSPSPTRPRTPLRTLVPALTDRAAPQAGSSSAARPTAPSSSADEDAVWEAFFGTAATSDTLGAAGPQSRQHRGAGRSDGVGNIGNIGLQGAADASHAAEPARIEVAIGRIEVRAAAPAPVASARRGPRLTLQEYLQQGRGRAR